MWFTFANQDSLLCCLLRYYLLTTCCYATANHIEPESQISSLEKRIKRIEEVKYYFLIYGFKTTESCNGQDREMLNEIMHSDVSLKALITSFPRLSMLVAPFDQKVRTDTLLANIYDMTCLILMWSINLCKSLWFPNARNQLVTDIEATLNAPLFLKNEISFDVLLTERLEYVQTRLETIHPTLTGGGIDWYKKFTLFIQYWSKVNLLIEQLKNDKLKLIQGNPEVEGL